MNYHIGRLVLSSLRVWDLLRLVLSGARFAGWSTAVLQPAKRTPPNTNRNQSSNTQRTEKKTTDVVIHQHSRRLLKMDILTSETCWAHNKLNKIASDIKLVFRSSNIAMMHGPINIRLYFMFKNNVRASDHTQKYCNNVNMFYYQQISLTHTYKRLLQHVSAISHSHLQGAVMYKA